jgi:hypothetical protein
MPAPFRWQEAFPTHANMQVTRVTVHLSDEGVTKACVGDITLDNCLSFMT